MATIGTVTVNVVPKVDAEAIDAIVREAVADALRRLADSLTAKPATAPDDEPRYQAVIIQGVAGIVDWAMPTQWAAFDDETDYELAIEGAVDLNNGDDRSRWVWSTRPTD